MADEFCLKMPDFHVTFRDFLHAVNLRHGTDGFTYPPKGGVLRIFSPWKIQRFRSGLNPRTWVPNASTLPVDHRSRVCKGPPLYWGQYWLYTLECILWTLALLTIFKHIILWLMLVATDSLFVLVDTWLAVLNKYLLTISKIFSKPSRFASVLILSASALQDQCYC